MRGEGRRKKGRKEGEWNGLDSYILSCFRKNGTPLSGTLFSKQVAELAMNGRVRSKNTALSSSLQCSSKNTRKPEIHSNLVRNHGEPSSRSDEPRSSPNSCKE